ncbi:hypothetical protein LX36DRAFT_590684 [Colletotrichum falcatum]|nr:hypothetical protein LX36DRAFT_590684 [Colletotrichum falcatum]
MLGSGIVNEESLEIVNDYYSDWKKLNPGSKFPENLTVTPSSSYWPSFKSTSFYKTVRWTFNETESTVRSVQIIPKPRLGKGFYGADMRCHIEHKKPPPLLG